MVKSWILTGAQMFAWQFLVPLNSCVFMNSWQNSCLKSYLENIVRTYRKYCEIIRFFGEFIMLQCHSCIGNSCMDCISIALCTAALGPPCCHFSHCCCSRATCLIVSWSVWQNHSAKLCSFHLSLITVTWLSQCLTACGSCYQGINLHLVIWVLSWLCRAWTFQDQSSDSSQGTHLSLYQGAVYPTYSPVWVMLHFKHSESIQLESSDSSSGTHPS